MAASLMPMWPCWALLAVIIVASALLFMCIASSHRSGRCLDCHEPCDGTVLCVCCRRQGGEGQ